MEERHHLESPPESSETTVLEWQVILDTLQEVIKETRLQEIEHPNFGMLLKSIGPTMVGVKAAELLTYPLTLQQSRQGGYYKDRKVLQVITGICPEFKTIELQKANQTRHIFCVHQQALENTLGEDKVITFLQTLGYPKTYNLDDYLETLTQRMLLEPFPHEVGIFLGYPLDDVKGFMGYSIRPLAYIEGWQVYDPSEAAKLWTKLTSIRLAVDRILN